MWTSGTLGCCKQRLEDSLDLFLEDQNANMNGDSKDGRHEVLMRTKILLGVRLEAMCVVLCQRICLHCFDAPRLYLRLV